MGLLRYRAGKRALRRLRESGLSLSDIQTLVFPATGPKWLATAGIDRALAQQTTWGGKLLVAGASAGAWRALAFAAREPARAQERLRQLYCGQHFTRADGPDVISASYRKLLSEVFEPGDLAHAVTHPRLSLAITCARIRGSAGSRALLLQLAAAGMVNVAHPAAVELLFERVQFRSRAGAGQAALDVDNVLDVALASGTVPHYMSPVRGLERHRDAAYLDGGLVEYHVSSLWPGLTVLVSHDARVIPGWFDKLLPWRDGRSFADDLLVVYPDRDFIRALPGGRIPSRDDFTRLLHTPDERIRNWLGTARASDQLGDVLLEDLRSGSIAAQAVAF
jgi:hypothetical protein